MGCLTKDTISDLFVALPPTRTRRADISSRSRTSSRQPPNSSSKRREEIWRPVRYRVRVVNEKEEHVPVRGIECRCPLRDIDTRVVDASRLVNQSSTPGTIHACRPHHCRRCAARRRRGRRYLSLSNLFAAVRGPTERSRTRTVETAAIRVEASRDLALADLNLASNIRSPFIDIAPPQQDQTHWPYDQRQQAPPCPPGHP
jgi:hypothetical protein